MKNPTTIYGIKNCDTMKKAFAWLDGRKIAYAFHDYKKDGADAAVVKRAISELGWENALNRKGTTWRQLPDTVKESMNAARALETALQNPAILRRPLLIHDGTLHAGFDAESYAGIFRRA